MTAHFLGGPRDGDLEELDNVPKLIRVATLEGLGPLGPVETWRTVESLPQRVVVVYERVYRGHIRGLAGWHAVYVARPE